MQAGGVATEDDLIDGVPRADLVALLSAPPEEFVAVRTARAKELRAEGRRDEAAALSKVRKPVRLVWAVGEVARRDPELAAEAIAGAEDAEAAMAGSGDDIRTVLARYRELTGRVGSAGGKIDRSVDRAALELGLRQVLADPAARTAWLEGRLVALPGEDQTPADELAPRRARRAAARKAADASTGHDDGEATEPEAIESTVRSKAEARTVAAERKRRARQLERALHESAAAQATLTAARAGHDDAVEGLQEVQQRLAAIQAEAARAAQEVDDAVSTLAEAERAVSDAVAKVDDLEGD
jgi:chromosome segregation ATPase